MTGRVVPSGDPCVHESFLVGGKGDLPLFQQNCRQVVGAARPCGFKKTAALALTAIHMIDTERRHISRVGG